MLSKPFQVWQDVYCEGHFGIYQPADEVERYITRYLRELQRINK